MTYLSRVRLPTSLAIVLAVGTVLAPVAAAVQYSNLGINFLDFTSGWPVVQ